MVQVEAVIKMLDPDFSVQAIAVKRRVRGNPWFKQATLYRNALDVLRNTTAPMTTGEIVTALLESKGIKASKNEYRNLEAGIRASLDNHNGRGVERTGTGWSFRFDIK